MAFMYATVIVVVSVFFIWLMAKIMVGSVQAMVGAIILSIVILGVLINISLKENEKGPCHQYETQMMYNAATKTMMPSRVCVLRGEWVKEGSYDRE